MDKEKTKALTLRICVLREGGKRLELGRRLHLFKSLRGDEKESGKKREEKIKTRVSLLPVVGSQKNPG